MAKPSEAAWSEPPPEFAIADQGPEEDGPSGRGLTRVGVYDRVVRASLERAWENVFDWEHLPWLHRGSFAKIALVGKGAWGWRAQVGLQPGGSAPSIDLGLFVRRRRGRYVSATLAGPGAGTEIWTWLETRQDDRTGVRVEFWLPDVAADRSEALGKSLVGLYTRLWNEDEAMMIRRTDYLAARAEGRRARSPAGAARLGLLQEVIARAPFVVTVGGERVRVVELAGELLAHSVVCPHMGGPLDEGTCEDGAVRCPWHGYRFDLRDGSCPDQARLRLGPAPSVRIDDQSIVWLDP